MIRSRLKFAGDVFPARNRITEWDHYWEYMAQCYKKPIHKPTGHNSDRKALARIDEGRWIADCPWGCGSAFNLPEKAIYFWCTECVGGGFGLSCDLIWPEDIKALTTNMESLPSMLQYWPCVRCRTKALAGQPLCVTDEGMLRGG